VPGVLRPDHNGHLDVIRRAANLYDEVVVAVVNRSVRKDKALFGIEERMGFIERSIAELDRVRAEPFSTSWSSSPGRWRQGDRQGAASDLGLRVRARDESAQPPPGSQIESVYLMASRSTVFYPPAASRSSRRSEQDRRSSRRVAVRLQEELRR